jgi:hypothetical protein
MRPRRAPPPGTAEETDACFIAPDTNGQEPGQRGPPGTAEETDACFIAPDTNGQEPGQRGAAKLHPRRGPPHRGQHRQAAGVLRPHRGGDRRSPRAHSNCQTSCVRRISRDSLPAGAGHKLAA